LSDYSKPVAENVSALMAELDDHKRRVDQALARDQRTSARDANTARRDDTRRKIIMGGAVMAEAKADPEFAKLVTAILKRRVADPRDRLLLALDIDQLPQAVGLPSPAEFEVLAAAAGRSQDEPKH
jgi:hypothetical protein